VFPFYFQNSKKKKKKMLGCVLCESEQTKQLNTTNSTTTHSQFQPDESQDLTLLTSHPIVIDPSEELLKGKEKQVGNGGEEMEMDVEIIGASDMENGQEVQKKGNEVDNQKQNSKEEEEKKMDKTPKLLHCFHSFCQGCLEEHVGSVLKKELVVEIMEKENSAQDIEQIPTSATKARAKSKGKRKSTNIQELKPVIPVHKMTESIYFPCPICNVFTLIPKGGVSELPNNIVLQKMTEQTQIPTYCEICEKDEHSQFCLNCYQYYCDECQRFHKKSRGFFFFF